MASFNLAAVRGSGGAVASRARFNSTRHWKTYFGITLRLARSRTAADRRSLPQSLSISARRTAASRLHPHLLRTMSSSSRTSSVADAAAGKIASLGSAKRHPDHRISRPRLGRGGTLSPRRSTSGGLRLANQLTAHTRIPPSARKFRRWVRTLEALEACQCNRVRCRERSPRCREMNRLSCLDQ